MSMPRAHVVRVGEDIGSIAAAYGFFPSTLWEHPNNDELRGRRGNGYVLQPGDVVAVPELERQSMTVQTNMCHRFRRKGVPERFKVQLAQEGIARADVPFTLIVDGQTFEGTTDAEGRIDIWIPPDARTGKLVLGPDESYELALGGLDPVETDDGLRTRLRNLGHLSDGDDDVALAAAVASFQSVEGLDVTGTADDQTRDALLTAHRS